MRREQKVEKRRRERLAIARARVQLAEKEREREREKVHVGFLLPFFFFSSLRVLLLWLTFSLFFRPNLGAQIEALESFTKREIPQRYKFELWNNKRYTSR
jgi:hypothetical protein